MNPGGVMTRHVRPATPFLLWLWFLWPVATDASAQETRRLTVGTKHAPPFSVKNSDGSWSGISIALWNRVAAAMDVEFDFVERDLSGLLEGVESGDIDVVAAALTMTPERERLFDFSHAFHHSGLGIAVHPDAGVDLTGAIAQFPWGDFARIVSVLVCVLLAAGALVWVFERRRNAEQFGGADGLWSGFWWSAVTMTTVGYGDKAPLTPGGRVVGLVWMFASLFMISAFTATFASVITTARLSHGVRDVEDLPRVRVAAVRDSTGAAYLERRGIVFSPHADAQGALQALRDKRVDAVVYDAPILQYLTSVEMPGSGEVLPERFVHQQYALALGPNGPPREEVNQVLLGILDTDAWEQTVQRELGER